MKYKVKPCPFCGGRAYLEKSHRVYVRAQDRTVRVALVRCTQCHARGNRFAFEYYGKTSHSAEAVKKAVDVWNRRVGDV